MTEPAEPGARRVALILPLVFGSAGIAFMVIAFLRTWDETGGSVLPSWTHLLGALLLVVVSLSAAGLGWARLLDVPPWSVVPGFFLAQLGKYIPGGVWQPFGQVGFAATAGIPARVASAGFVIHALVQVVAAATAGAAYPFLAADARGSLRFMALAGVLSIVLLHRGWMTRVLRLLERRVPDATSLAPSQRAILAAYGWSLVTLAAVGTAFALLISSVDGAERPIAAVPAFALAWAAGFLALPVPAGIGVREAVLVATVGPAAPVVAASVAHRLVTIVAEASVVFASRVRRR